MRREGGGHLARSIRLELGLPLLVAWAAAELVSALSTPGTASVVTGAKSRRR